MGVNYQHYFLNNYYFSTVWNYSLNKYLLSATDKPGSVLGDGDTLLNKTKRNECVNKKRTFLSVTCSPRKNKNVKAKKQNMVVCYSDVPENV